MSQRNKRQIVQVPGMEADQEFGINDGDSKELAAAKARYLAARERGRVISTALASAAMAGDRAEMKALNRELDALQKELNAAYLEVLRHRIPSLETRLEIYRSLALMTYADLLQSRREMQSITKTDSRPMAHAA